MRARRADVDVDLTWLEIEARIAADRQADAPVRLVAVADRREDPRTGHVTVVPRQPIRVSSRWGVLGPPEVSR